MKKSGISMIVVIVLIIAYFVLMNVAEHRFTGSYAVAGKKWDSISYEVQEGNAEKLTVDLKKADTIKVVYDGKEDVLATLKLKGLSGEDRYVLKICDGYSEASGNWERILVIEEANGSD